MKLESTLSYVKYVKGLSNESESSETVLSLEKGFFFRDGKETPEAAVNFRCRPLDWIKN